MSIMTDKLWEMTEEMLFGNDLQKDIAAEIRKIITDNSDPVVPNGARKPSKLGEFVEWAGKEYAAHEDGYARALVRYMLEKAQSLLKEEQEYLDTCPVSSEAKMEQKPPANGDLVEELESLCERYSKRDDDKGWTDLVKGILRKYTPVPAEQGLREELEDFTAGICPTELADDIRNTLEDMLARHPRKEQGDK